MDVGKAHDQEGGEEEDPAIDICTDPEPEEEDTDGLSPGTRASWNATIAAHAQAPRPDNTFGSPFALQCQWRTHAGRSHSIPICVDVLIQSPLPHTITFCNALSQATGAGTAG